MTARNDGEVQALREHRSARWSLAAFVVVVAALVPSGQALAVDQAMEPNSILAAESFVGAQMTTPEDGRLRGYGFAATITSNGTAEGATRLLSTFRPAPGQRLVAFAFRLDLLREDDTSHPVRATLVVDGRRSALDDGDFVRSGERMYAASVPNAAEQVDLEMSAAGLAQAFSLTDGHRVGDQPVVLYRDPAGPDVVSDVNDERTLSATSAADGAKGAVTIALKRARLSYFSPGEPITTAGSPNRAFLIVEGTGDSVQPPYGDDEFGRYFSTFAALAGPAVKARLPDGTVVEARHAGSDEGLLGGWYYFEVPADLTTARITIEPGTVEATQYRGFVGQPARITLGGSASFDVPIGSPAAASPTPMTAPPAPPAKREPEKPISEAGDSWPLAALLAALTAALFVAGLVAVRRQCRSAGVPGVPGPRPHTAKCEDAPVPSRAEPAKTERLLDIAGKRVALDGPGAEGAARAAIVEALVYDGDPPAVVVLASGPAANLVVPTTGHQKLRLVRDEDQVLRELEVVSLQQRRLELECDEAGERARRGPPTALVVVSGPLEPKVRRRVDELRTAAPGESGAAVICLGGNDFARIVIDENGGILTPVTHTGLRRVPVMTKAEAATALASLVVSPPAPCDVPTAKPAGAAQATPLQSSAELISIRLLGPYRITVGESEVASGLRAKARELLAYLAVNRDGATMDAAVEALWPQADPDKGQSYFRTVVANLRSTLRAAAGLEDARAVVERVGPRYRLDPDVVVIDLWQFSDGLRGLNRAVDVAGRERAADSYGGEFAAREDFTWAGPIREQLRCKAIDNLTALAEGRRAANDLEGALRALERAIELDSYGEELYSAAMRMQLLLGRRDAAGRTLRLLEQRLAEIDLLPQEGTRRLLSQDSRT